ncbi:CheA signal transduction histidine kinase [Desulfurobacterium thermolithotrophum DSM 11699]|uniref:histidine kinase n=1 Tax=Desulfurobacterium thermolithotrophum (strain DSM 11699 / BSA) TaxID=868864 RepID=F0S0I0_DESTD|nr:chemotaxis protein CheA [Desulfurobacterium thermolithotrophum]ADY72708.1 CheA signal transduction histidine kinase [Desulfurobacterium thermolithotrophum DSM 11699]
MKANIPEELKEILEEFLVEAEEILENLDQDLIDLENNPTDKDLLNKIFRGMHTLKGGAGFLNLTPIVELAHRIEDIFNKLRNDEMTLTTELMDIILEGIDHLKLAIQMLKESEELPDMEDIESVLKKLDTALKGEFVESPEVEVPSTEDAPQESELEFVEDVSDELKELIKKFPGKNLADLLEEIILMPPDERPMEVIPEIEKLIEEGKDIQDIVKVKKKEEKTTAPKQKAEEKPQPPTVEERKEKTPSQSMQKKAVSEKKTTETIRIDVERVENLMNLVGEIVLDRNRILRVTSEVDKECRSESVEKLVEAVTSLDRTVSDLQVAVMKLRMQPIKKIFSKFPRLVRDLARKLNKKVQLIIEGEDTELDRSILDKLEDPLIHLVRNALDHGIEPPEERVAKGKPEVGTVKLFAYHEGDHIIVGIQDDGKGIDPEKVKQKAIEKGLITPEQAAQMSEKEAYELIFMPGFSTAEKVSDVSGRGVGMDVVASTIHSLRGSIEINSELGKGTTIILKLPLTVAIIRTLMISVKDQVFAVPLHSVVEIVRYDEKNVKEVGSFKSFMLRDEVLPLFSLNELLELSDENEKNFVVIVKVGERLIAVSIEELFGEEEIVIKSLGELLSDIPGIAGATIAGDGKVVLILDLNSLLSDYKVKLIGVGR